MNGYIEPTHDWHPVDTTVGSVAPAPTPQEALIEALLALTVEHIDITPEQVAESMAEAVIDALDLDDLAATIAGRFDADDIAQHIDTDSIASSLADDISDSAIAEHVAIDHGHLARCLRREDWFLSELAEQFDLDAIVERISIGDVSAIVLNELRAPALDGSDLADDLADASEEHASLLLLEERLVQAEERIEALTTALRTAVECLARAIEALA